jgi:hypothetical protein
MLMVLQARPRCLESFDQLVDGLLSAELILQVANKSVPLLIHQRTRCAAQSLKDSIPADKPERERVQRLRCH